jgi:hypothetical protein
VQSYLLFIIRKHKKKRISNENKKQKLEGKEKVKKRYGGKEHGSMERMKLANYSHHISK